MKQKKIRRLLAFGLLFTTLLSLTACNGGTDKLEKNEGAIHCFTDEVMAYGGYDKENEYDEWIEAFDNKVKLFVLNSYYML